MQVAPQTPALLFTCRDHLCSRMLEFTCQLLQVGRESDCASGYTCMTCQVVEQPTVSRAQSLTGSTRSQQQFPEVLPLGGERKMHEIRARRARGGDHHQGIVVLLQRQGHIRELECLCRG